MGRFWRLGQIVGRRGFFFGSYNRMLPENGSFWVLYGSIERLVFRSTGRIPIEVGEMRQETKPNTSRNAKNPCKHPQNAPSPYYMVPSSRKSAHLAHRQRIGFATYLDKITTRETSGYAPNPIGLPNA